MAADPSVTADIEHPRPSVVPAVAGWDPGVALRLEGVDNPLPRGTMGAIGLATKVSGPDEFPLTILYQRVDPHALIGIEAPSVRAFRFDVPSQSLIPVWNSGINV